MLNFKKVSDGQPAADHIAATLRQHLAAGRKVLWLLPGGSATDTAVTVAHQLQGADLANLTVSLTDERYGLPGHADSNWQQLLDAGLDLPGAQLIPVLTGEDIQVTAANWQVRLQRALAECDYKLGFLGMGADGHTSGILPNSPAVTAEGLVAAYDGGQFQRITTTPKALEQLNEAVVLAMGDAKRPALEALQTERSLNDQPAQLLKAVQSCTIFNDQIGETS